MRYVKNAFNELFNNYRYSQNIIHNANIIVKEEILQKDIDFLSKNAIFLDFSIFSNILYRKKELY